MEKTAIKYHVWEPAIESSDKAIEVEAGTPRQAAFMAASAKNIGHRKATFMVEHDSEFLRFDVEPHVWYSASPVAVAAVA